MLMVEGNLALAEIENIPWETIPFMKADGASDTEKPASPIASPQLDEDSPIPLKGTTPISYGDDVWRFNQVVKNINSCTYDISFKGLDPSVAIYCKNYVLRCLIESRVKIPTISNTVLQFSRTLNIIDKPIETISEGDIRNAIDSIDAGTGTKRRYYNSLWKIFSYIEAHEGITLSLDTYRLKTTSKKLRRMEGALADARKTPNIPEELYASVLEMALKVMEDDGATYNDRLTAATLVILTQTGLRASDLMGLKIKDLHSKAWKKIGRRYNWIHYQSRKPTKAGQPLEEFDIFASPICAKAYKTAIKLRKSNPPGIDSPYLYKPINRFASTKDDGKPTDSAVFLDRYRLLLRDYLRPVCERKWEGINLVKVKKKGSNSREHIALSIPSSSQYRVHLATTLYEKQVPLEYIRRFMGHLSGAMEAYYVRPKDEFQENIELAEKIIKEVVGDDVLPLGGIGGPEIRDFLKNEAKEGRIDVFANPHELIERLGGNLVIRGKTGGYCCIRATAIPCSRDASTNDILCAYGACPNLHHFYHMADMTYLDFQSTIEAYTHNTEIGKPKAAAKELNKAKAVARNRLLPELDELKNTISEIGKDEVLSRYPSLSWVIENEEYIRKEAFEWISRKQ